MTTVNGTEVYGLIHCNDAIRQLYASVVNGGTDTDALRATCEEKCLAYTEATDFTNAKNCSDPAGSLPIGAEGSSHPWLKPLYEFVGEVEEKVENGESTNYILDFVAPHTVGSKIFPELADGDRNITQIANAFKDGTNAWQAWQEQIALWAQADVEENDLWDMCRRLRSHDVDVNCWDEEQWSEYDWSEYDWSEDEWSDDEWSEDEDMDEEMEKERNCRIINYAILSDANPKEYPAVQTEFGNPSYFYQYGTNCIAGGMLVADCDCSDAENYNFQNQELCDELKQTENKLYEINVPQSIKQGMDKMKSLVCGNNVSDECIDAQKSLKAEENFIQKGFFRAECEAACAEFPNETCGFLVNSVSMILFALLAMLKY